MAVPKQPQHGDCNPPANKCLELVNNSWVHGVVPIVCKWFKIFNKRRSEKFGVGLMISNVFKPITTQIVHVIAAGFLYQRKKSSNSRDITNPVNSIQSNSCF